MSSRLFVLNLPHTFSESQMRDVLDGCNATSVEFVHTIYGVLTSIELASEEDAANAKTILAALKLPAPIDVVRGESGIGTKLGEILTYLTKGRSKAYSDMA